MKAKSLLTSLLCCFSTWFHSALSAHPLDEWQVRYSVPTNLPGPFFHTVTFGKGLFVAVGTHSGIATSETGEEWALQNLGTGQFFKWAAYGNDAFVIVGLGGTILSSPDGTNWTPAVSGTLFDLNRVEFGNGVFVAVGPGNVLTSANGTNWTKQLQAPYTSGYILGYGNGLFIAESWPAGSHLLSADGAQWTAYPLPSPRNLYACGGAKGRLFLIDTDNNVFASKDGILWKQSGSVAQSRHGQIAYGYGQIIACGGGRLEYSNDGINWTLTTNTNYGRPSGVAFGHGTLVGAQGRNLVQSSPLVYLEARGKNSFSLEGPEGRAYEIQSSLNPGGPWNYATNFVLLSSPQLWQDPEPNGTGEKFYRAVLQP